MTDSNQVKSLEARLAAAEAEAKRWRQQYNSVVLSYGGSVNREIQLRDFIRDNGLICPI